MGHRSLILVMLAACGGSSPAPTSAGNRAEIKYRVSHDFENAVKTSKEAYVALFDFAAVGEIEILLHRYDLNGRLKNLSDEQKTSFAAEDGTPYPAERERRNVGNFYKILAQRTVGTGECNTYEPRTQYAKLLGQPYEPLPEGTPPGYEILRTHANEWLANGGVVGVRCKGGKGGLALVWTKRDNAHGYELITIYDD